MGAECVRCWSPLVEGEDEGEVCMGCADHVIPHEHGGYGFFPGGDPRCFSPDEELCSPEEVDAHAAACERWDEAERAGLKLPAEDGSCAIETVEHPEHGRINAIVTRARFGLGGYSFPCTDPNCEDSWPRDPEPDPEKFMTATTWEAAIADLELIASDDEDVSDQEDEPCS